MTNIAKTLLENLINNDNPCFLIDDIATLSSHQFISLVQQRYLQLLQIGIHSGDKILVQANRGNQYWIDVVVIWLLQAILVPIDINMDETDLCFIVNKVTPDWHITLTFSTVSILKNIKAVPEPRFIPDGSMVRPFDLTASSANNHTAAILLTSGSSGIPKGVCLSHQAILINCLETLKVIELSPKARLCVAIAKNFTSTLCHFLAAAFSSCTFISTDKKLLPANLFEYLRANKATAFAGSPLQLRWLAECAESRSLELSSLSWFMSSGDFLYPHVIRQLQKAFPHGKVITAYGLTELGGRFCILPAVQINQFPGSVGFPIANLSLTVRDEMGKLSAPMIEGEIYAEGSSLMNEYYREPEITSRVMTPYGLKTGDLGYIDQNNMLYLCGRNDDVFKCAGQKVSTFKISAALQQINVWADFAILPVVDAQLGRVPCVYYVSKPGAHDNPREIITAIKSQLDSLHLPRKFIPVEKIPRTDSGKIDKRALIMLTGMTTV